MPARLSVVDDAGGVDQLRLFARHGGQLPARAGKNVERAQQGAGDMARQQHRPARGRAAGDGWQYMPPTLRLPAVWCRASATSVDRAARQ